MIDYKGIIKTIRNDQSMTQTEFGLNLGVNQSYINKLEGGEIKVPSLEIIQQLVIKFNVNPYLFIHDGVTTRYTKENEQEIMMLRNKLKRYEKLITKLNEEMVGKTDKK